MMDLAAVLAIGGLFLVLFSLAAIILYLLMAFGLYKLAQKESVELSWLAFIPVAQLYIIGKLIKELKIYTYVVPRHELVLPISALAYLVFSRVPVLGFLVWLATMILTVAALYYLFKKYKGDRAVVMTVLSVVLPFMGPIFVFSMRDAAPLDEFKP